MTVALADPPETPTLADLIERLGDVPLFRVFSVPAPGTATEADVLDVRRRTKRLCELVDGVLVEKAMSYKASVAGITVARFLDDYVLPRKLGIVAGEAGMLRIAKGLIRIPDVSFVAWDRVPGGRVPDEPVPGIVPNLAVEVLSPSNTAGEMARKRADYFSSGVDLVWIIDPVARTAEAYTAIDDLTSYGEADALDGGTVLPGFTLSLAALFESVDRRAA